MKSCKSVLMVVLLLAFAATAADARKLTFKFTTIEVKGAQDTRVFGTNNAGTMVGALVDSGGVDHGFMLKGGKVTIIDTPKLTFTFQTFKVPGAQSTAIFGINNAGVMVGSYVDKVGVRHGFRFSGGKVKKIDDPNGTDTYCFGINDKGWIVGWYANSASQSAQAFLYQEGTFSDIGPAGSNGSQAIGINDRGDINGNFGDSNRVSHGFLLKGGKYTTLDVPGAQSTLGGGINNAGLMTEVWIDSAGNAESSRYNGKKYTTIDIPKEANSDAGAISNLGDIVYSWEGAGDTYGGALLHGGTYYKFHVPGGDRTFGYGINDHNTIVGTFTTQKGVVKGFLATY